MMQNRPGSKKGGGIALIYKHEYNNNIKLLEKNTTITMEYIVCKLIHKNKPVHIIGIYHPQPSTINQKTNETFIDEINDLLTEKITNLDNLIILGDLNINNEDTTNAENTNFQ